jgi:dehydrogenase/reductase SDR family member 12
VRPVGCDVSSLAVLRAFAGWFGQHEERLDVLVDNAGVMPGERIRTVDGVELTFATHVLASWILIDALAPLLRNAAPSRVVNVTSGGQCDQKIPGGDIEPDRARYGPERIYARAEREELVLTGQWARRLAGTGVHVRAMHPGWAGTAGVRNGMPVFRALTRPVIPDSRAGRGHHRLARRCPGGCGDDRAVLA